MRLTLGSLRVYAALAALIVAAATSLTAAPSPPDFASKRAEPGVTYGRGGDAPLPKTVLFSASPDEIIADAEEWSRRGIGAFFLDYVAREWSSDIWAVDGKPWTIGESDETFQKVRRANEVCRRIGSETFLKVSYDHPFEWFNETAWQRIDNNFRQFAIFARDTGCTGMAIDIEYIGDQYAFDWNGYTYKGYTRKGLIEKIRERMTKIISILYDEFPRMIFLTFPEEGFNLGTVIHVAWIEEAARRGAPGGVHYCTEGTYRNPNIRYMFAHAWACNQILQRFLSDRGRKYWVEKCSIAEGLWPFGLDNQAILDPGMSLEEYRQGIASALMASRRYIWLYSHNARELMIGRALDKYHGTADIPAYLRVLAEREVITTPKYATLARGVRDLRLEDYSEGLGVVPVPRFAGPSETPGLALVPEAATSQADIQGSWDLALKYFAGEEVDLHQHFGTQTEWMLIGPFANPDPFVGHKVVYPPEEKIDLSGEYDGLNGKVRWKEYKPTGSLASVDLTKVYKPTEHVCAYALCYVTSPAERRVQLRVGTNDSGKVWVGKELVLDYPYEGTAVLDREVIPVTLPKGTTPILLKICNRLVNWGFVLRFTDEGGLPAKDLAFSLRPTD